MALIGCQIIVKNKAVKDNPQSPKVII